MEASWCILGKKLQDKNYSVIRLPVYLPNEQNITIESEFDEDVISSALNQVTMLMMCDEEVRNYLYTVIPCYYRFKKEKVNGQNISCWVKRSNHYNCIGRMYSVSPIQIKLFYLRLLLLTIKGATTFEHLRTVNGQNYQTFTAICLTVFRFN